MKAPNNAWYLVLAKLKTENKWAKWVMGVKEGTCDEHCVLYLSDESLNSITNYTNFTLYVN